MPAPGIYRSLECLEEIGISFTRSVIHHLPTPALYEEAVKRGEAHLAFRGPLVLSTGPHTGRAVNDRFIVEEPSSKERIWWGKHNQPISEQAFTTLVARIAAFYQHKDIFMQDLFVGADPKYRIPIRVITEMAVHSLFARTMLVRPEDHDFSKHVPDITVLHAPNFHAAPKFDHTRSDAFIVLHPTRKMIVIGGSYYAGEMKKAIFSMINYLMPLNGILSMHCSANVSKDGESALLFGLSGTGKTTLSADPERGLIGDDEHGWSDDGVFNFEGGCYAKVIRLSQQDEPEIFQRTQAWGSIIENVPLDPVSRRLDLNDASVTENTRAAYPLALISYAVRPSMGGHPKNIVLLTCDAFGIMPPIAKLTIEQALYYFISGYSAKVAGTEIGLGKDPEATFSTCFGAPFMTLPPSVYAKLLGEKIRKHKSNCWLINTGWTGGPFGIGKRINIAHTRTLLRAALDGKLSNVKTKVEKVFGLAVPVSCPGVPPGLMTPRDTWTNPSAYDMKARDLANRFKSNFEQFRDSVPEEVAKAGPK